mmetsp:Transcript_102488/g.296422  ORF Transcript_102488/g.296422 Transcript_102488/m.296422 type:complete len:398 (+) Transcript_102488:667-1860(+)
MVPLGAHGPGALRSRGHAHVVGAPHGHRVRDRGCGVALRARGRRVLLCGERQGECWRNHAEARDDEAHEPPSVREHAGVPPPLVVALVSVPWIAGRVRHGAPELPGGNRGRERRDQVLETLPASVAYPADPWDISVVAGRMRGRRPSAAGLHGQARNGAGQGEGEGPGLHGCSRHDGGAPRRLARTQRHHRVPLGEPRGYQREGLPGLVHAALRGFVGESGDGAVPCGSQGGHQRAGQDQCDATAWRSDARQHRGREVLARARRLDRSEPGRPHGVALGEPLRRRRGDGLRLDRSGHPDRLQVQAPPWQQALVPLRCLGPLLSHGRPWLQELGRLPLLGGDAAHDRRDVRESPRRELPRGQGGRWQRRQRARSHCLAAREDLQPGAGARVGPPEAGS